MANQLRNRKPRNKDCLRPFGLVRPRSCRNNGSIRLQEDVAAKVRFNADGLVPAVAQDAASGQVLMLAWMDDEALARTLSSGRATYWSRSRQIYWVKGETSGHVQRVVSVHLDCDGDALLLRVEQTGAACHTGNRTCFFTDLTGSDVEC